MSSSKTSPLARRHDTIEMLRSCLVQLVEEEEARLASAGATASEALDKARAALAFFESEDEDDRALLTRAIEARFAIGEEAREK